MDAPAQWGGALKSWDREALGRAQQLLDGLLVGLS